VQRWWKEVETGVGAQRFLLDARFKDVEFEVYGFWGVTSRAVEMSRDSDGFCIAG
jgi:hypothetical protein